MFTIKWHDPYIGNLHSVTFCDGWKRLNYCNAATYYRRCDYNSSDERSHTDEWYLVSYSSPVCKVKRYVNDSDGVAFGYDIKITESFHHWSVSSKKQLKKFLDNLDFFNSVYIDYYAVLDALRDIDKRGGTHRVISVDTAVLAYSDDDIAEIFKEFTPKFTYYVELV